MKLAPLRRKGLLDFVCRRQVFTAADRCPSLALVCSRPSSNTGAEGCCPAQAIILGMKAISNMISRLQSRAPLRLRQLRQQPHLLLQISRRSRAQARMQVICLRHQPKIRSPSQLGRLGRQGPSNPSSVLPLH